MIIVGIGGSHSKVGKTTLATKLLKYLTSKDPLNKDPMIKDPMKRFGRRWGAIKYTRSDIYCSVTNDRDIISIKDKDTYNMLEAGAEDVFWIQSPPELLNESIPIALEQLVNFDGIVVEGNSAVEFLKPDIVVFLHSNKEKHPKESASRLIEQADLLIHIDGQGNEDNEMNEKFHLIVKDIDLIDTNEFFTMLENMLIDKELKKYLLQNITEDRKISCSKAREIAGFMDIPYKKVGTMANSLKIKINKCELGCF